MTKYNLFIYLFIYYKIV